MSHTIKVNQRTCGKTTYVTATLQDDGDTIKIDIKTDCAHIQEYAEKLKEISTMDVIQFEGSKVEDPAIRASVSVPCMVPNGVFNASWLELGMLSETMANRAGSNDNQFVWEGHRQER